MLKRGKQEHYLGEVLATIVRCSGTQITYNALARTLSINHPATVSDYIALLTSMDVLCGQPALREDKLTAAPLPIIAVAIPLTTSKARAKWILPM